MVNANNKKCVTWAVLFPTGAVICIALLGASWALATSNRGSTAIKGHTHKDSVQYRELQPIKNDISIIKRDVRDIFNHFNIKRQNDTSNKVNKIRKDKK